MDDKSKSISKNYIGRVNTAIRYIDQNLDQPLNLSIVAKIAMYSPFHFHRIFSAVVNESLNEYISRKRIEKSTLFLKPESERTISEIANAFGYSSNAAYTKAFKKFYGISPSTFKKQNTNFSKIGKVKSKDGQASIQFETYICNIDNYKKWMHTNAQIEVKKMPSLEIAYVAHQGEFHTLGVAFQKLMRWAGPRGLAILPTIAVYHDDPNITDISKVRQAAGIILKEVVETSGEVSTMQVAAGKYAVGQFELANSEYDKAWQSMFIWIHENGFEMTNADCYQTYVNPSAQHNEGKNLIQICVPVK